LGLAGGGLLGLMVISWPAIPESFATSRATRRFAVCGLIRHTCVIDGDTIWLEGVKIRVADIDTPEDL
jgi:endonuclease YncB( thermonuclease family)